MKKYSFTTPRTSGGPHVRYLIMTLTTAFLLAIGIITIFFVIGKEFL